MHTADQIVEALVNDCWIAEASGRHFSKPVVTGGAFGSTTIMVRISENGRWFERVNGWGDVERDVDLRNFANDPQGAIAALLEGV